MVITKSKYFYIKVGITEINSNKTRRSTTPSTLLVDMYQSCWWCIHANELGIKCLLTIAANVDGLHCLISISLLNI